MATMRTEQKVAVEIEQQGDAGSDSTASISSVAWPSAIQPALVPILEMSQSATLAQPQVPIDSASPPLPGPRIVTSLSTSQRIARALGAESALRLTILSFVDLNGTVDIETMLDQGPPSQILDSILSLYDAGMLGRRHATVFTTDFGREVLHVSGIREGNV